MEIWAIIALVLTGWFILNVAIFIGTLLEGDSNFNVLPWDLHEETCMNWCGCIICSILILILVPLIWLGKFIYWLFHI